MSLTEQEEKQNQYARLKELVSDIEKAVDAAESFAVEHKLEMTLYLGGRSMSYITNPDDFPDWETEPGWYSSSDYC